MKTILACIDLSPISEDVIRTASQLATALSATLHLLHVLEGDLLIRQYDPVAGFTESDGFGAEANLAAERRRIARQSLELLANRLRSEGADAVTHLPEGEHMTRILDAVSD